MVVDRLTAEPEQPGRIAEAVATAFQEGEGVAVVLYEESRLRFTRSPACSACDTPAAVVTPALFSFNNPRGACPSCNGFGAVLEYDESLVVPDPERSLRGGAIDPWTKPRYESRRRMLLDFARKLGVDPDKPWEKLKAATGGSCSTGGRGATSESFPSSRAWRKSGTSNTSGSSCGSTSWPRPAPSAAARRLNPDALAVRIGADRIADVAARSIDGIHEWLRSLALTPFEHDVAHLIMEQLTARLEFLRDVGLGYLTLDRQTRTLSGGEAQRISLANALGANLVDTLYVLDEPSIGLHPRDTDRLLGAAAPAARRRQHRGRGGARSGRDPAGRLHAGAGPRIGRARRTSGPRRTGEPARVSRSPGSTSADRSASRYPAPAGRRVPSGSGCAAPRCTICDRSMWTSRSAPLTAVTGVSGSGKSTLFYDVIYRQLEARLHGGHSAKSHLGEAVGRVDSLTGCELIQDVLLVDQSPIGRSPRSNPITYIKAFDEIRELFAAQPLARQRKYSSATFSFNLPGGRCEACEGAGHVQVEMVFLADVFVPCEACGGTRYRRDVLDVRIQGHSIHDVLQWTVDEAMTRFRHQPKLGAALWHLQQVGLGYLRLGQPATTLSGGEAQRLKIARELAQAGKREGRRLYILDEPTTGLHLDDVRVLIQVLDRLVDAGHTVVVIEHHLDVIKRADWVIDLGPEAGDAGGQVVAQGTPEAVAEIAGSHTGRYLGRSCCRCPLSPDKLASPLQSLGFLLNDSPCFLYSISPRAALAYHQPDRVTSAQAGVGQMETAAGIGSGHELLVDGIELLFAFPLGPIAEAHQAERHRRHDLEVRAPAHPSGELLRQGDVAPDHLPEAFHPVAPKHEPQLQRPESSAELNPPVTIVDHLRVIPRAEILRGSLKVRSNASGSRTK